MFTSSLERLQATLKAKGISLTLPQLQAAVGLVAIVIIIAAGYAFGKASSQRDEESNGAVDTPSATVEDASTTASTTEETATSTEAAKPVIKPKAPAPKPTALTYEDALEKYRGLIYQFRSCRAAPGNLVVKVGAPFMLDNRDNAAHTIAIGTAKTYKLGSYGFVIATAPAQAGTYNITCDGGGAAKLTVAQ